MWFRADVGPSIGLLMFEDSMRRIDILAGPGDERRSGLHHVWGAIMPGLQCGG